MTENDIYSIIFVLQKKGVFPMHLNWKKILIFSLILSLAVPSSVTAKEQKDVAKMVRTDNFFLLDMDTHISYLSTMNGFIELPKHPRIPEVVKSDTTRTSKISKREMECFVLLIFVESGIEDEEGQLAVAATILNRVESSEFPNSIEEVAFQKGAFSSTRNGKFYINEQEITIEKVPEDIRRVAQRALEGEDPTEEYLKSEAKALGLDVEQYASGGALYFYNPKACSETALQQRENIKVSVKLGRHIYYKYWNK